MNTARRIPAAGCFFVPKVVAVALHLAEPYDGYDNVIGAVALFREGDGVLILIHVGAGIVDGDQHFLHFPFYPHV